MPSLKEIESRLNEVFVVDREWIDKICRYCYPCNLAIADHPSIQVWCEGDGWTAGFVGLLNGLIGKENRFGVAYDDDQLITKFRLLEEGDMPNDPVFAPYDRDVTVDDVVDFLNECGQFDPHWTGNIVSRMIPCSIALKIKTNVQVRVEAKTSESGGLSCSVIDDTTPSSASVFGLINHIIYPEMVRREQDDSGRWTRFFVVSEEQKLALANLTAGNDLVQIMTGEDNPYGIKTSFEVVESRQED